MNPIARLLFAILLIVESLVILPSLFAQQQPFDPNQVPAEVRARKQFQRWWDFFRRRAYPLGYIPDDARLRGLDQVRGFRARQLPPGGVRLLADGLPLLPGERWVNVGPSPVRNGISVNRTAVDVSGRIADIAVNPSDPNHWLIGAAQGGIWQTLDAGKTWEPCTDDQESLAMGAIAFAPGNTQIVYAGTGEASFSGNSYFGSGLLRSPDGGATWNRVDADCDGAAAGRCLTNVAFSDIHVDPADQNVLVAATTLGFAGKGISFADNTNNLATLTVGLYRSENGGANWTQAMLTGAGALRANVSDVEIHPDDFNLQYAGVFGAAGITSGVYRSTDSGRTWTLVPGPWNTTAAWQPAVGRIELALSPSTPNVLYVSINDTTGARVHDENGDGNPDNADADGDGNPDGRRGTNSVLGLWRTDNAWEPDPVNVMWAEIPTSATNDGRAFFGPPNTNTLGYCGIQCFYDHEIIVDPAEPDVLYAGGVPLWKCEDCTGPPAAGGPSPARWSSPGISDIHVDQHAMAWVRGGRGAGMDVSSLPLSFEENRGQFAENVRLRARGAGYTLSLTAEGPLLSFRRPQEEPAEMARQYLREAGFLESDSNAVLLPDNSPVRPVTMKFKGGNPRPAIYHQKPSRETVSYYDSSDPSQWLVDIPVYSEAGYQNLYPGIDLLFYGKQRQLEYDFVVSPGADYRQIRFRFEGLPGGAIELTGDGELLLPVAGGQLRVKKPVIYQEIEGRRRILAGGFSVASDQSIGFEVPSYDPRYPLVIDPVLLYSTYLGVSTADIALAVTADEAGNAYLTGVVDIDPDEIAPNHRAFLTKITPAGDKQFTILIGRGEGVDIAVDPAGNVYIVGNTDGGGFPVVNPIDPNGCFNNIIGIRFGFLTKVNRIGAIVYSTCFRSLSGSVAVAVEADQQENAYVLLFEPDQFVGERLIGEGRGLLRIDTARGVGADAVTYTSSFSGDDIALDSEGNVYLTGAVREDRIEEFIVKNAIQPTGGGGEDAFVMKVFPEGEVAKEEDIVFSTLLGGAGVERGQAIAVDDSGNIYVAGLTRSPDFPRQNALFPSLSGPQSAFLTKMTSDGDLIFSTYYGGSGEDAATGVAADASGQATIAGLTGSMDLETEGAEELQPDFGGGDNDAFLAQFSADGQSLLLATYLGGSANEDATFPDEGIFPPERASVAVDTRGYTFIAGGTQSANFPVANPLQEENAGLSDIFVARVGEPAPERLIVANDGGLWSTTDGGASWMNHNATPEGEAAQQNLAITQFYDGTLHPTLSTFLLGGAQDNGAEVARAGIWYQPLSGDGADNAMSLTNPDSHWALSTQELNILRTVNAGDRDGDGVPENDGSFDKVDSGAAGFYPDPDGDGMDDVRPIEAGNRPFTARFEMCPDNEDVVIAGTDNVWHTNEFFSSAGLPSPMGLPGHTLPRWFPRLGSAPNVVDAGARVSALAFARGAGCQIFAVGLQNGPVYVTRDGGTNYQRLDVDGTGMRRLPQRWVSDLALDNSDPAQLILYAVYSAFDPGPRGQAGLDGHAFRVIDPFGVPAWDEITAREGGNRIDIPHNTVAVTPDGSQVYVGTDLGVMRLNDARGPALPALLANWQDFGPERGMPNVGVFDIDISPFTGEVAAFTFGRSVFLLTEVPEGSDLEVEKDDDPDPVVVDQELTYIVRVRNNGPNDATGVIVTDTLPAGVELISVVSTKGNCTVAPIRCEIGDLPVGQEVKVTITVRPGSIGNICNETRVQGDDPDPDETNNADTECTRVKEGEADLSVTKRDSPDPVLQGRELTYFIIVRNNGPDKATEIVLTDVLPAGALLVAAIPSQGTCAGDGPVICNLGELDSGRGTRVTLVIRPFEDGEICNEVEVSAKERDENPDNNRARECTTVEKSDKEEADLAVTKTDTPDPAAVGENVTFTVKVTNFGPSIAVNAQVREFLPAGGTFVSATPSKGSCGPRDGDRFFCSFGDLAPGESVEVLVVVRADPTTFSLSFCNDAFVFMDTEEFNFDNDRDFECTEIVERREADLEIVKLDDPDPVSVGENVTYTVTVTNHGPIRANDVRLTDTLPAETSFISATASQGSCAAAGQVVTCQLQDLDPEDSAQVTIVARALQAGNPCNQASVSGSATDPDETNNQASACTTVQESVKITNLSIVKTDNPDPVKAGEDLTYTLTVTNDGPDTAGGVQVTDNLPGGVAFISADADQGSCSGTGPVVCQLGNLAAGAAAGIRIVVRPTQPGEICNQATVSGVDSDSDLSNNSAGQCTTVEESDKEADLSISKTDDPDPVSVGSNLTYTIRVTNSGPDKATGVEVTDTLPPGVTFVSAAASQGSCSGSGPVICNLGNLAKDAVATITTQVRPRVSGVLCNQASVSGSETDPEETNNEANVCTTVEEPDKTADLILTKTDAPDPVAAGQPLTYTVIVTNQGPDAAEEVTASDSLPAGVTLVGVAASQGSCSGTGSLSCSLGELAKGAAARITVTIIPSSAGMICNTASAAGSTPDPDPSNNSATECSNVTAPLEPGEIRGIKFDDQDGNGVQKKDVPIFGGGEPGLSGWTLFIDSDNDGELDGGEPSVLTDPNGAFRFADIPPGSHVIREVQQSGWVQTTPADSDQGWRISVGGSFETEFGDALAISGSENATQGVDLSFNFPFAGTDYDRIVVTTEGYLWLGTDAGVQTQASAQALAQGAPRIAPYWTGLGASGSIYFRDAGDRAVITWEDLPRSGSPSAINTFQLQLLPGGEIFFSYNGTAPLSLTESPVLIGLSPGGQGAPPAEIDFSQALPLNTPAEWTAYELIEPNFGEQWELDRVSIRFVPGSSGAHRVELQPGQSVDGLLFGNRQAFFVVNSEGDSADLNGGDGSCDTGAQIENGDAECTLRAAIEQSNLRAGQDAILFDIPGPGPHRIRPLEPLPVVLEAVVIDGTSEPDFAGSPVVEISGASAGDSSGLIIEAGNSVVKGLVINEFENHGLILGFGGGNVVQGNFIGSGVEGDDLGINGGYGLVIFESANNRIGGSSGQSGNLISGNDRAGILILGPGSTGNVVQGNIIGPDLAGTDFLENLEDGIFIANAPGNRIGGSVPLPAVAALTSSTDAARNPGRRNESQLTPPFQAFEHSGAVNQSRDPRERSWTSSVPSGDSGTFAISSESLGPGNLLSGNNFGITIAGEAAVGNVVEGNRIGTDITGTFSLSNLSGGILITELVDGGSASRTRIGGTQPGAGNLISGNDASGLIIANQARENLVQGNWIGLDAGGLGSVSNLGAGVILSHSPGNRIGGPVPAEANVIAGNEEWGIRLRGESTQSNRIEGNLIGLDPNHGALGNGGGGVLFEPRSGDMGPSGNSTGGIAAGVANRIAYNNGPGVRVEEGAGNALLTNRIYANLGLGIALGDEAVTPNDSGDVDAGPNNLQNFPFLATAREGSLMVTGSLESAPGETYRLEFFLNAGCDASGHGQGEHYLGSTSLVTNAAGVGNFEVTLPVTEAAGQFVTATATDANGNTSEFSACIQVVEGPVTARFYFPFYQADAESFTGFAVSNFSTQDADLHFESFQEDGQANPYPNNPAEIDLPSGRQLARLGNELFGVNAGTPQSGWVEMTTENGRLGSFFLFGKGNQLDGSVALTQTSKTLYFTRVFDGPGTFRGTDAMTFLGLSNPNATPVQARLTLTDAESGSTASGVMPLADRERTLDIPARGFIYAKVSEIFKANAAFSGGFVRADVIEGDGIVGFQLVQLPLEDTALGLNAAPLNDESRLYSAQLADGAGIFTNLKLINAGLQSRSISVKAIGEDGSEVASGQTVLQPGEFLEQDAGSFLGLDPSVLTIGSLAIETDGGGVIGDVIFGDPVQFRYAAAMPLQTHRFKTAVFSQVANLATFFTGLAIFNPGPEDADVTIEVYSAAGAKTGEVTRLLRSGQRLSQLVPELIPSTQGQVQGYIIIRSTSPLVAQQLFGDTGLNLLSAVPPTIVE